MSCSPGRWTWERHVCGMARMRNHAGVGGFEEARFSFGHHPVLGPTVFGPCVGGFGWDVMHGMYSMH